MALNPLYLSHLCSSTSLVYLLTELGVDNANSGICYMYVCKDGTYAPKMRVRKFLRKSLLFKKQKVAATCYYGIETLYQISIQNFAVLGGIRSATCWLSRVIDSQNAVVLMLRNLLLLEGS